jgi:glycogen operon protein
MILNAYWKPQSFELPPIPNGRSSGWRRIIDTFRPSPDDFCDPTHAPKIRGQKYRAQPRSVVVLVAEREIK